MLQRPRLLGFVGHGISGVSGNQDELIDEKDSNGLIKKRIKHIMYHLIFHLGFMMGNG